MHVGRDDFTGGMVHVGELLGQLVGRKKVDARFIKLMGNNQGEKLILNGDLLNHS